MAAFLFNILIYVFLLLCLRILTVCLCIFIVPTGTLRLPWLRFFRAFSSVVRQMPGYNSQRQGTARTLPRLIVLFCLLFVCKCVLCYCHRVATQLLFNKYINVHKMLIVKTVTSLVSMALKFDMTQGCEDTCWNPEAESIIIYNKPTRCNSGSIVFIKNYKYALHVSDALCVHLQEHYKL